MYRSHYNLMERPFEISTDTRFLWMGEKHKEALAMLKYGVLARKGFLLLTGDVGTGKTTLVNALMENLNDNTLVANITDPLLEPLDFFNFIAASFGMEERFDNKVDFLVRFERFLLEENKAGKNVLLILDEAHRFSKDLLEQFRLLSNIELPEKKLINMFLVGQNEFNRTLMSADCRALRQRITLTYSIKPLTEAETLEYIRHRLKIAGSEAEIFHRKAVAEIYRFSQGYPRLINIICDHALLTGFVKQINKITPTIIKECSQELSLMGDTIRISSSDFFDSTDEQDASTETPSGKAEAQPASNAGQADAALAGYRAPGTGPQAPGTSEATAPPPVPERLQAADAPGVPRTRYWIAAACVAFLMLVTAFLFQQGRLRVAGETDRTASATAAPAPETITLTAEEPLAAVQRDRKMTSAELSPYERAREEMDQGNLDQAIRLLERAIAGKPADLPRLRALYSETLHRRAGELSDRGEPGAEKLLAGAVEADPTNEQAYFDLGKLHTKAKRYPDAIGAYRKAATLNDRSPDTFFNLGFVYSATGDYGNAEKMFRRAAALRPPYLDKALFNLAAVQCKQDKRRQCIESLEEALAENPDNQRARTFLSQLKLHAKGSR
jgi:type II secretory pathway predicted ATPase ExeA/tetratricopeptide (TPR) repeat protein